MTFGLISIPAVFLRRVTAILNNAIFLGFYWLIHFGFFMAQA